MIGKTIHQKTLQFVRGLQRFAARWWYPPLVAMLAIADNFVLVLPTDGILVSSVMLVPKRWLLLAVVSTIGSTIGALTLAGLVEVYGLPLVVDLYPSVVESPSWALTSRFFEEYGLYLVFLVSMTPLMQQPVLILAGLAVTPLHELAPVVFLGKGVKSVILAYIGSHAPRLLKNLWGVQGELKDVGIRLD